jgi:hypothetical protein
LEHIFIVIPIFGIFYKEVARGGERTQVLSISFIFSFFTTLPLSHSGSPSLDLFQIHTKFTFNRDANLRLDRNLDREGLFADERVEVEETEQ